MTRPSGGAGASANRHARATHLHRLDQVARHGLDPLLRVSRREVTLHGHRVGERRVDHERPLAVFGLQHFAVRRAPLVLSPKAIEARGSEELRLSPGLHLHLHEQPDAGHPATTTAARTREQRVRQFPHSTPERRPGTPPQTHALRVPESRQAAQRSHEPAGRPPLQKPKQNRPRAPNRYRRGSRSASELDLGSHKNKPKWRNRQTRRTQNPFPARECEFKSHLRHQLKSLKI
jgi:hypothetical protein